MPNEVRVRSNGVVGTTTTNLEPATTTLVSPALQKLAAVANHEHADVTLYDDSFATPIYEIVRVTAHAAGSDTATIIRGIDGTQKTWPPGTKLSHSATAEDFKPLDRDVRLIRQNPPAHTLDDEFDDNSYSSAWLEHHTNANVVNVTEAAGVLSLLHTGGADGVSQAAHTYVKAIPVLTYPFAIQLGFRMFRRYAVNYQMIGPIFTDGLADAAKCVWQMPFGSTSTAWGHTLSTRSGTLANVVTDHGSQSWEHPGSILHCRLTATAANTWKSEWSPDGVSWITYPTGTFSSTMTPTHCGFAISNWGASVSSILTVEYFRVTL